MSAFEQNPARALRAVPPALKTFGRYEAHAEIGDGAMGRVYRGFDPLVGRFVAIKTVKAEYLTRETRAEYLRRFRREAQAAGRLAHPNIVSIFDVGEDYFVMEYVEGITLAELLRYRTALDVVSGLRVLAPVAEALDYAHRAGVVHRDIKPANIMVQPDGRPKLMDFGVARLESSAMTSSGQFFGSPSYMAPEQILGSAITHEADLFSFAVVAYEAFTGKRPYQGDSITTIIYKVVNESPALPRTVDSALPAHFDEVFRRALSKQPSQRYATGMEFVLALAGEDLEASLADLVPEPIPEAKTPTLAPNEVETQAIDLAPARRRRRALMWAVPAAAVIALVVEIGLLVGSAPVPPRREERAAAAPAPAAPPAREAGLIETTPAGAAVWIDERTIGRSPVSLGDLEPGEHRIRLELAGHAPADFTFPVAEGAPPLTFNLKMSPLSAPLRVTSSPSSALVTVDGRRLGATPLDAPPLVPGRHQIRIEREGYKPFVRTVIAEAGKLVLVHAALEDLLTSPSADPHAIVAALAPPALPAATPVRVFEGMFVNLSQVDSEPRKVSGTYARVPASAKRRKGTVEVEMVVTHQGHPTDVTVTRSAGPDLDEAVRQAVRGWRFEPARKNGVKVSTRYVHRSEFR
ncbi:MAG TPA: TonB family protein [Vicinamibacteria bacterium]|nr:TonB family protein [Vicinamibacteria bacterium]